MKNDNEHSMRELIMKFVKMSGKQQLYSERIIKEKWPEYVGDMCAKYSECKSVHDGVMMVKVSNAALRFELNGRKSMIIEKINNDYKSVVIKDILFS